MPAGINRLVDTRGKKEVQIYESIDNVESVEEYVEVQTGTEKKHYMSSSDFFEEQSQNQRER